MNCHAPLPCDDDSPRPLPPLDIELDEPDYYALHKSSLRAELRSARALGILAGIAIVFVVDVVVLFGVFAAWSWLQ